MIAEIFLLLKIIDEQKFIYARLDLYLESYLYIKQVYKSLTLCRQRNERKVHTHYLQITSCDITHVRL